MTTLKQAIDRTQDKRRQYFAEELRHYKHIDARIAHRYDEIMHEWKPTDTNIGGGSSNRTTDPTGALASKIATDPELARLKSLKAAVTRLLHYKQHRDILHEVFIYNADKLNHEGLAEKLQMPHRTLTWRKRKVLDELITVYDELESGVKRKN